jgi:hypothetical protein
MRQPQPHPCSIHLILGEPIRLKRRHGDLQRRLVLEHVELEVALEPLYSVRCVGNVQEVERDRCVACDVASPDGRAFDFCGFDE